MGTSTTAAIDGVPSDSLDERLSDWSLPPMSPPLTPSLQQQPAALSLNQLGRWVKGHRARIADMAAGAQLEHFTLYWLYRFVRQNVKRGRLFELNQVIDRKQADCLGYVKIFHLLGQRLGLDTGIVEVPVDNAGRYVPHVANIVRLADGTWRFVDLWYGSTDIHHRMIALQVKEGQTWRIRDVSRERLAGLTEVKGLPAKCIDAITCYVMGNRHLQQGLRLSDRTELARAIEYYDLAIRSYPQNARFYFNRAIARENAGESLEAAGDYRRALRDERSRTRVLAREYEESTRLIELDRMDLSLDEQQVYLLRKGFVTGQEVDEAEVATRCGESPEDVRRIMSVIATRLSPTEG